MFPFQIVPDAKPRSCGACMACCEILAVPSLAKPVRQPCPYQCNGCGIYSDRPAECREFSCLWLMDHIVGDDRRRPDQLGLMFAAQGDGAEIPALVVWEVVSGAIVRNQYLLDRLATKLPLILIGYTDTGTIGEEGQ